MQSRSKQRTLGFGAKPKPLTVTGVLESLNMIAALEGNNSGNRKISVIKGMLVPAREFEPKFLIRQLQGKLRIGLAETSVLTALAHALVLTPPSANPPALPKSVAKIDRAMHWAVEQLKQVFSECPSWNLICPAVAKVGLELLHEECHLTPGVPVHPMLAKPTKGITEVLDRFTDVEFTCEYKYDGERAQVHRLADGRYGRHGRAGC